MTAILCPYCNAPVNLPLKFCVACGRAISANDIHKRGGLKIQLKAAITKRLSDTLTHASFARAKKTYRVARALRQFLLNFCYLLILLLLFYTIVKYVARETVPGPKSSGSASIIKQSLKKQAR